MLEMLSHAGIVSLVSMVVGVLPMGAGIAYAIRPTEQRLALMRPLSLAAIFAGSCGTLSGFINTLRMIAVTDNSVSPTLRAIASAESLVPLFVALGALTVAWLCAAIGLRRHP